MIVFAVAVVSDVVVVVPEVVALEMVEIVVDLVYE